MIRQAKKLLQGNLAIGAGTVLNLESLKSALGSGASVATFGASVFKKERMDKGDYKSISRLIKAYTRQIA